MRYATKVHTIEFWLTELFPFGFTEGLDLNLEVKNESRKLNDRTVREEREKLEAENFYKHKELLIQFAPDELKPLILKEKVFPMWKLSEDIRESFKRWHDDMFNKVLDDDEQYDEYFNSVKQDLSTGCLEFDKLSLNNYKIANCRFDRTDLIIRLLRYEDKEIVLSFKNTEKFEYDIKMEDSIWIGSELYLLDDGRIEIDILYCAQEIESSLESLKEIRIICSDIVVIPRSN